MKIRDLLEDGRIVKGVNTTDDVGVNQTSIEAAKFGNKVTKDGVPPTLSTKVKGKSTNVLFNLGLTEDFNPVNWLKTALSSDPQYKAWVRMYKQDPQKAKRTFGRKHAEFLAQYQGISESLPTDPDAEVQRYEEGYRETFNAYKVGVDAYIEDRLELTPDTIKSWGSGWQRYPNLINDLMQYYRANGGIQSETRSKFTDIELALMEGGHSVDDWVCGKCNAEPCVCSSVKAPGDLFNALEEKWSAKYKRSINCNNPKGFSQRAHCQGRNKNESLEEALGEISPSSKIYVDMDGVLADFFGEWARLMNVEHFTDIHKQHDINDALQKIRDTDDFWLRLPMLPEAKNLLNLIKKVKGSYNICSSPLADDPNSERHKRTWVKEHLSFFPPDNVYITHNKPQFATNEDGTPNILIDDYGVNIRAWEDAGGIGFKYKDHKFERTANAIKQAMQDNSVTENFADGKRKGKSRPGRVKRSGASCKGSVTSLRKRAKNASGEKARMYHWCANMKSGRKKK